MKNPLVFLFAASALVFAAAPPAAAQSEPAGIHHQRIFVLQDEKTYLDEVVADAGAILGLRPDARPAVVLYPLHGSYYESVETVSYTPQPGFFGRDALVFGRGDLEFVLEIRVLPRFIPVAGFFENAGEETVALYDNLQKLFRLCHQSAELSEPLICKTYTTASFAHRPMIPLAWPDLPSGLDQPALFDPASGELYQLEMRDWQYVPAEILALAGGAGSWPVVGDWLGSDQRSLALVSEQGEISLPGVSKSSWSGLLPKPLGDELIWPIVLPRTAGGDAIALVEPATGDLSWVQLEPSGATLVGVEPCLGKPPTGAPLVWNMSPNRQMVDASPEVFFLQAGLGPSLMLVPGIYSASKPQTIPVKFPDDPPFP